MSQTTQQLKQSLKKSVELLQTLRDEVRVKIHLAGMDAKDEWNKLEPKVEEAEKLVDDATQEADALVHDLVKRLQKLNKSLS